MVDIREGLYTYHRNGLDILLENQDDGREKILQVLRDLKKAYDAYQNRILIITFLDAKADELVNIFSEGNMTVRREARELLVQIDPTQQNKYDQILKN